MLYPCLANLDMSQLQAVYTHVLLQRDRQQIAPLYIQDSQLHFYTATGPGQPIDLTPEQSQKITNAFVEVQVEAGITSLLEKSALVSRLTV